MAGVGRESLKEKIAFFVREIKMQRQKSILIYTSLENIGDF